MMIEVMLFMAGYFVGGFVGFLVCAIFTVRCK